MDADIKLLEDRFFMNMKRVGSLTTLVSSGSLPDTLNADINRAAVIFLHATFEDMLRTAVQLRRANQEPTRRRKRTGRRHTTFNSYGSVGNALRQMRVDTQPFEVLHRGLDSLMQRRHQIVHTADVPNSADREAKLWSLGDNLLLVFWLLHVLTFYTQLRIALDPSDALHGWYLARRMTAVEEARQTILDFLRLSDEPHERLADRLDTLKNRLAEVGTLLGPPSDEEIREIARRMEH